MYSTFYKYVLSPVYERVIKRRKILTYRSFLSNSQWWPRQRILEYQRQERCKLLAHAWAEVPYWREMFRRLEIAEQDLGREDVWRRIPIVTKEEIRRHRPQMMAKGWVGRAWTKATGGSTGIPLEFAYTPDSYDWRVAVSKRGYGWAGCEDGMKQGYIWGAAIGEVPWRSRMKEALHHWVIRQRHFNAFEFDEERMAQCLQSLVRYQPKILVGYTNPLYNFAQFIQRAGGCQFRPTAVITGAEALHAFQRTTLQDVFGCEVFNTYGSREFMLIASECERHHGLHVNAENLVVEILQDDGSRTQPGDIGRVVITDLHNYAMPFIRYEIGDLAVASEEDCVCGRGLPLLAHVVGRSLDMIRTPDGRHVPGEFFPHLMKEFAWVKQFQVIQDRLDRLTVKIVKDDGSDNGQLSRMRSEIEKVVGQSVHVEIRFVAEIPVTRSGKRRVTVSDIQ